MVKCAYIYRRRFLAVVVVLLATLLMGCGDILGEVEGGIEKEEVFFSVDSSMTRTSFDGESVKWTVGDEVALWATGVTSNNLVLSGEQFTLRYYGSTFMCAEFSAMIDPLDPSQEYRYKAFYPYSNNATDSSVEYTILANQNGGYDGSLDFRVADEVVGSALTTNPTSSVTLAFRPLTHILKFQIPEGHNLLEQPIKQLEVTLPTIVAGDIVMDMNNTTAMPTISSGGRSTITLTFDEAINAGHTEDIYMFINPIADVTGVMSIVGIGEDQVRSKPFDIQLTNHTFAAGRITPVGTEIGESTAQTTLTVTISENNIGEPLTFVNFTAPDGAFFEVDDVEVSSVAVAPDEAGNCSVSYNTKSYADVFRGKTLAISLETKHCLVPETISLSGVVDNSNNTFSRSVPYLLYENFDDIKTFSKTDDPSTGFGQIYASADEIDLSGSSYGLSSGWRAKRCGALAGYSIRVACRNEMGMKYEGWIQTPTFDYIKKGETVTVSVSYDYGGGKNQWGSNDGKPQYYVNGDDDNKEYQGDDSSFTTLKKSTTREMSATKSSRYEWSAYVDRDYGTLQNGNYWLYLDNIKVTIK